MTLRRRDVARGSLGSGVNAPHLDAMIRWNERRTGDPTGVRFWSDPNVQRAIHFNAKVAYGGLELQVATRQPLRRPDSQSTTDLCSR